MALWKDVFEEQTGSAEVTVDDAGEVNVGFDHAYAAADTV